MPYHTTTSNSALTLLESSSLECTRLTDKARETVEKLHDWMYERIVELLEPCWNACFKYQISVEKDGYLNINYQLSGVDTKTHEKVGKIVSATTYASRGDAIIEAEQLVTRCDRYTEEQQSTSQGVSRMSFGGL